MTSPDLLSLADELKNAYQKATVKDVAMMLVQIEGMKLPPGLRNTLLRLAEERISMIRRGLA